MDEKDFRAKNNINSIIESLKSPMWHLKAIIIMLGLNIFFIYALNIHITQFKLSKPFLVLLESMIFYAIGITFTYIMFKAYEKNVFNLVDRPFLKVNLTKTLILFILSVGTFIFASYMSNEAYIPVIGTPLYLSLILSITYVLFNKSSSEIKNAGSEPSIQMKIHSIVNLFFIGTTIIILADVIYTPFFNNLVLRPVSDSPIEISLLAIKIFLDMGIFIMGVTISITLGILLIYQLGLKVTYSEALDR
ncbi:MAG: hypothetical protein SVJ22_05045 [Halobacteriota archaeon]|nr:hypothetical protein [Halobacteriota archaeon]